MRYLRTLRKESGLSSKEISELLGISNRSYLSYETGDRDPSFASLEKLEDLFGTSYRDFLKEVV